MQMLYYTRKDIMAITGMSKSWSEKRIAEINQELKANGHVIIKGQVPMAVFNKKFALEEGEGA